MGKKDGKKDKGDGASVASGKTERTETKESSWDTSVASEASVGGASTGDKPEKNEKKEKKRAKRKDTTNSQTSPKESGNKFQQESGFKGKPIAMTGRRYGVAITWDPVDYSKPVDLDLQAIIVDKRAYIVDAVYYNNLVALNGAVSHSGDEVTGQASDFDEMVWAVFAKLPEQVKMLLFVVAACGDSALRDAANATVHVVQEFHGHTVLRFPCEKSRADVDIIVMMEKDANGKWWLYQVEEPAEHGEHFLDILEPTIGDIIRRRIDNAPKYQRVTFQMKKGAAVDLPKNALKRLNFSVMAVIKPKVRKEIDLDCSAVFTDKAGNVLGVCWHEELEKWGFQHAGDRDNDEDMNVDMTQIPTHVHQIYIIVDLVAPKYKDVSFNDITYASCMANDQNCKTLASFTLESGKDKSSNLPGLILCKLVRNSSKRWELEAVGRFCPGPSWKEAAPTLLEINAENRKVTENLDVESPPAGSKSAAKRRSRMEYRGSLPPAAAAGSSISPDASPAEAEDERPPNGEMETTIMRTLSFPEADPSMTMTMSMPSPSGSGEFEGGEERRAARRTRGAKHSDSKDKGGITDGDSVVVFPPEGEENPHVSACRRNMCFLCPRE